MIERRKIEMSKLVNTRLCIEEAILELKPDISDQELLNLREKIYYKVWKSSPVYDCKPSSYAMDYYLYSRKRYV